ncbi:MAG: putative Fe-S protein YdhL (DUF1289 family) [Phenylobacterium sp.]|jgi:predicted Fe-S protein YdhL (DUF1289 family)
MQQLELLSIENPCINVCESNKRGYCLGCFRSRDERFNWNNFSAEEKGKILALCKKRAKRRKTAQHKQQQPIPVAVIESQAETPVEKVKVQPKESVQDMGLDMFDL